MAGAVGSVLRTLGHSVSAPSTPSLAVTDNEDGMGGVASITGSDAAAVNTVYTSRYQAIMWSNSGHRTGDGTISLALAAGLYWGYVESVLDDRPSLSQMTAFALTGAAESFGPEQALRQLLMDAADYTELVGIRCYPQDAPQAEHGQTAFPLTIYRLVDADHQHHIRAATGYSFARIQLDHYALTYSLAIKVADAARLALDGYKGIVVGVGGTLAITVVLDDEHKDFGPPADAGEIGYRRVIQDYIVGHSEKIPTFS